MAENSQGYLDLGNPMPLVKPIERRRVYYLDWLRVFLTTSVILFHCVHYLLSGWWLMHRQLNISEEMKIVGRFIWDFNQSYFMSLFFFLSGLFTTGSYEKKRTLWFLVERALRLIVPTVVFDFALCPFILWVTKNIENERNFFDLYKNYTAVYNVSKGPMWFPIILFLFELGYCLSRMIPSVDKYYAGKARRKPKTKKYSMSYMFNFTFKAWAIVTVSCFFMRVKYGYGCWFPIVGQAAFLPAYFLAHLFGTFAMGSNFVNRIPTDFGYYGLVPGVLALCIRFAVIQLRPDKWHGSLFTEWQLLATSLEAIFAILFSIFLLCFFRKNVNLKPGRIGLAFISSTYAVYIVHLAYVWPIQYYLNKVWEVDAVYRFLLNFFLSNLLSWPTAMIFKRIPIMRRIL